VSKRHRYVDAELSASAKVLELLTLFHPPQRRRILATVNAKAPLLPYLGTEPEVDERQIKMFDEADPPIVEFPARAARPDGGIGAEA
jgi:hypothetical protein